MHANRPWLYSYQSTACHSYDVTSVTHSRLTRKIQALIVLPIRSGNKENPGKL
ncbi:Uncharacterised protein [Escherichia coli]|uniref:Uncharacterized protein n=1 Tax=Escherichia coli TaxID=562 RepID=A0A376LLE4_ECOLX|nr:Uncharacterised protein [Escherichia coli]